MINNVKPWVSFATVAKKIVDFNTFAANVPETV